MTSLTIAAQEIRAGLRNRWILATTLLMAGFALSLVLLGSAPTGTVGAAPLAVIIVSLASLTIFLVPLMALLLSFDSIVGEHERGTLILLLAHPVSRWEVVAGKILGQVAILAIAIVVGYSAAAAALAFQEEALSGSLPAFAGLVGTSVMLGASFIAMGCLASTLVGERATAAGLAVGVWLFFVLIFDAALLGVLVADGGRIISGRLLDVLLLLNPGDAYRLFNTTAIEGTTVYAGLAGPGETNLPPAILLGALAAWIVLPALLAVAAFRRRAI